MSVGSSASASDMDGVTPVFAAVVGVFTDVSFAVPVSVTCNKINISST